MKINQRLSINRIKKTLKKKLKSPINTLAHKNESKYNIEKRIIIKKFNLH